MVRFSKRGILNHNEAAKKTLLNFDLSLYRKVVYEACNDMGVSKKEIDQELLALLEKHKDELKTGNFGYVEIQEAGGVFPRLHPWDVNSFS